MVGWGIMVVGWWIMDVRWWIMVVRWWITVVGWWIMVGVCCLVPVIKVGVGICKLFFELVRFPLCVFNLVLLKIYQSSFWEDS